VRKFIARFANQITGVLSGFDRLIFRGRFQRLCYPDGVRCFLGSQGVLLKDFEDFAKGNTKMIHDAAADVAKKLCLPTKYLESSRESKEDVARAFLAEQPMVSGPICMLSCVEPCSSWRVWRSRERKHPQQVQRWTTKCLHYYLYCLDPEFGFMHVRIQTWMPFMVQVYVNGREWLGRQLDRIRMRYTRADNCFPHLADPHRAQQVFDGMLELPWARILDNFTVGANPALSAIVDAVGADYNWTIHQSEWATDVMFRDAAFLSACYPALVRHAVTDFSCVDVMRFLGKRLTTERAASCAV